MTAKNSSSRSGQPFVALMKQPCCFLHFPAPNFPATSGFLPILVAAIFLSPAFVVAGPTPDSYSVLDFGAKADGKTDDTAAFQKTLDAAAQAGGGTVYAPRGNYFFAGHLTVPNAVTLKG